jgi:hypothetical protein
MGSLFSTVASTATGAVGSSPGGLMSGLAGKMTGSVMSAAKGKAKDKLLGLLQKVIGRYMNEACTNPTAFVQKILDDMKAQALFPSAARIALEEQRADVEAGIAEVLKTPEMQKACQTKDAKAIAQQIMDIMTGKINLEGSANNTGTANATNTTATNANATNANATNTTATNATATNATTTNATATNATATNNNATNNTATNNTATNASKPITTTGGKRKTKRHNKRHSRRHRQTKGRH